MELPLIRASVCLVLTVVAGCVGTTLHNELRLESARPLSELAPRSGNFRGAEAAREHRSKERSVPLFDRETELSLPALVQSVLERNPSLAAMQSAWRAAVSRYPQATALDDPMFSYGLAPGSVGSNDVDLAQKVDLSQRFPFPGKLRLRGEVALSEAEASRSDFDTVRARLLQETKNAFFDYYYAHRAIEINEINLSLLRELQRIAEARYAAGTVEKQDALQAEVERYHLEHRAIVLERLRKLAQARINTLLHRRPEISLPPPPKVAPRPEKLPEVAALQTRAVNARPELQALAHRIRARETTHELADKEYFPDFTVMGTYDGFWEQTEQQWMLSAGVNLPLQLGRRSAAVEQALAERDLLKAEFLAGVDKVAFEVTDAHDRTVESEHVVTLYRSKVIPTAEENLKAARSGYENGKNDFLALLTAEKNLMIAQLEYQQALTAYHQSLADLERAVGDEIARPPGEGDSNDE